MLMIVVCFNFVIFIDFILMYFNFIFIVQYVVYMLGLLQIDQDIKLNDINWYIDILNFVLEEYYKGYYVFDKFFIVFGVDLDSK